jgi:hypothetical protein
MHDMIASPIEASGLAAEVADGRLVRLSETRPATWA